MGRSHESATRREILKRGAVVGGGVLWVTPVVQTLGMGSAYAAPVSGSTCGMTLTYEGCSVVWSPSDDYRRFSFKIYIPAGCDCNPLPVDYKVYLIVGGLVNSTSPIGSECYSSNWCEHISEDNLSPDFQAKCAVRLTKPPRLRFIAESNVITIDSTDLVACT